MAKQSGTSPLRGTIGNTTYSKTRNGYIARAKSSLEKAAMDANPRFQALRDQTVEFTRALKAGKLVNNAFSEILKNAKDNRMNNRLSSLFNKVVKLDLVNPRGKRNVLDGELELLTGFEFNERASLSSTLSVSPEVSINRASGEVTLEIASLVPSEALKYPQNATHFKISMAAAALDFEKGEKEAKLAEDVFREIGREAILGTSLTVTLSPGGNLPVLVVCKLVFATAINGIMEAAGGGTFTACTVVKTDTGV